MEEFKIGDQVTNPFRGIGIIVKPPHVCVCYDTEVRLDGGYLSTKFWEDVNSLTKIKPKVKRWRWVVQNIHGGLCVTHKHQTEEEVREDFYGFTIIQKVDITEKEFDE